MTGRDGVRGSSAACAALLVVLGVSAIAAPPAQAQLLPPKEQACITTFNKTLWKIGRTQADLVKRCLREFAAGIPTAIDIETCMRSNRGGKLATAVAKGNAAIASKCAGVSPAFGVSAFDAASVAAALTPIHLVHGVLAPDLTHGILPNSDDATCQSRVAAAILTCHDTRLQTFLKCQRIGMKSGFVTNSSTLTDICLGSGDHAQPDLGRIAVDCDVKIAKEIARSCRTTPLTAGFAACGTTDPAALGACVDRMAACTACRYLNEADGLVRDCDRLDDGNGANGTCGPECGDGIQQIEESCDDGNATTGDGCSGACKIEGGWSCGGAPSVCTPNCGTGTLEAGESCDDGAAIDGDGCSSTCFVEDHWSCSGAPSVCTANCGNGTLQIADGETCDDGNLVDGDGCSSTCGVEDEWVCTGAPSICTFLCGNQVFDLGETCDDGNGVAGDGCNALCKIEPGWLCSGLPSTCAPVCGDGRIRGAEACDDGDVTSADGCSFTCQIEAGFTCEAEPRNCIPICGDGFVRGAENCDDGNTASEDGCSGEFCRQEVGWACLGQPSVCTYDCGDGNLDADEECDDGDTDSGDGCSDSCLSETGYACHGQPSLCVPTCGNGLLNTGESCDDGNVVNRDGCDASCRNESGWLCTLPGVPCQPFEIFIDSPAHGTFTTANSVTITGHYTTLGAGQAAITINGAPASSVNLVARTFSHTVSLSTPAIFNPVLATLTNTTNGDDVRDRLVVIKGASVLDGTLSPQSVAMRMNDTGLDKIEPLVAAMAGDQLNLAALIPPGTVLADECFINVIGCWGSAKVKIANPAPSFGSFGLTLDSKTNAVGADIAVRNLRIDIDIDGSGLVPDCGLRLTATQMSLNGDYSLEPAANPRDIDVNLVGAIGVGFTSFNHTFTYGLCDAPIIGDIIQAFLPDIQQFATDGIKGFIGDPDGAGPQDSPIAEAMETTLAGISITGPVGSGLGMMFDAPLFKVVEDATGITFGSNASFSVSTGGGPGQCVPPPGAPNFTASYAPAEPFPNWGATTPVGQAPYGIGLGFSSAAFNQLLRGQTECGLMRTALTTIDLDGAGGVPPVPITSSLLSLLVPEFAQLPPETPLRIDIAPTLAPIVTGVAGPGGELTELRLSQISVDIVQPGSGTVWLSGAFDVRLGLDMDFLADGSGLAMTISVPEVADTAMTVIDNPLGTNEAELEQVLPSVFRPLIPELAGALSGFPIPQFFGLRLQGVEVSKNGSFLALFANLTPTP